MRVCILDSGVEAAHPLVGGLESAMGSSQSARTTWSSSPRTPSARSRARYGMRRGVVRRLAPAGRAPRACASSERLHGLGWRAAGRSPLAIEEGFDVINMSLSTAKAVRARLPELTDRAYFSGDRPRRLGAQHARRDLSLALRLGALGRPATRAPIRSTTSTTRLAGGILRPWRLRGCRGSVDEPSVSGNSFATPHMASICALILSNIPS